MATNIIHLQNLRSKDILSGSSVNPDIAKNYDGISSPKLPTSDQLEYGDIALNIAKGYETLAIKNIEGDIVYIPFNILFRLAAQDLAISSNTQVAQTVLDSFEDLDLVHAAVFARMAESIGLDENGVYSSSNEFLADRSMADAIEAVYEKMMILADYLSHDIRKLSAYTESQISALTEELRSKIEEEGSCSKEYLTDYVEKVASGLTITLTNQVIALSGDTDTKIEALRVEVSDAISNLSSVSQSSFDNALLDVKQSITDLKSECKDIDNEWRSGVDSLKANTSINMELMEGRLNEKIDSQDETLNEKIDSSVTFVTNSLTEHIDENTTILSGEILETKGMIAELHDGTSNNFNNLSSRTDDIYQYLVDEELVRAAAIAQFNNQLGFNDNGEFEPFSEELSGRNLTEAIDYLYDTTTVLKTYTNDSVKSDLKSLNEKTKALSSVTDSLHLEIEALDEDVRGRISSEIIELEEKDEQILQKASAYTDTQIDSLSGYVISETSKLAQKDDEVLSKSSQYTDTQVALANNRTITLEAHVDELEESYKKKIESAKTEFYTAMTAERVYTDKQDAQLSGLIETTNERHTEFKEETYINLSNLSSETRALSGEFISLSAYTDDTLAKDELVKAAATVQFNNQLGFNDNGEFEPFNEVFSGRSVTEAIDYLYDKYMYVETKTDRDVEKKIKQLSGTDEELRSEIASGVDYVMSALTEVSGETKDYIDSNISSTTSSMTQYVDDNISSVTSSLTQYVDEKCDETLKHHVSTVTYKKLIELIENNELVWGKLYRIQDYFTTVNEAVSSRDNISVREPEENCINCGFMIIVQALSSNHVSENAICIPLDDDRDYDHHFDNAHIAGWNIKYSVYNDTERFEWADEENGTGVIYYMQDEFGNEAPYDFKNIQFNEKYTFNASEEVIDLSLDGTAYANVIKPCMIDGKQVLNRIQICADSAVGNIFMGGCYNIQVDKKSTAYENNIVYKNRNGKKI